MKESETIVEYSTEKVALNDYPRQIVSPVAPSACCGIYMRTLGAIHCEDERPFTYKLCQRCGYTVRLFLAKQASDCPDSLLRRNEAPQDQHSHADTWDFAS